MHTFLLKLIVSLAIVGGHLVPISHAVESESSRSIDNMSLEELMDIKISVASNKAETVNKSAGIVTLITADEIAHMGARDLMDVLHMVPGFSIGYDTTGGIGFGFRGLWAYEGKELLLIDGQDVVDLLYGNVVLGKRFPVNMIDRIEIIRGPGSVKYGNSAELVVINVVTKLAAKSKSAASLSVGQLESGSSEMAAEGLFSSTKEALSYGFLGSYTSGVRSDGDIVDSLGASTTFEDNSELIDQFGQARLEYGKFTFQWMYNKYTQESISGFGENLPEPVRTRFVFTGIQAKYQFDISSKWNFTPYLKFTRYQPWASGADDFGINDPNDFEFFQTVDRTKIGFESLYEQSSKTSWLVGYEHFEDLGKDESESGTFVLSGKDTLNFDTDSAYVEGNHDTNYGTLTFGVRWEDHSGSGDATVPRLGWVKEFPRWGYKILLSEAYRTPQIFVVDSAFDTDKGVIPEKTKIAEIELNKKIGKTSFIALNLYTISIDDPIYYFEDGPGVLGYENGTHSGSNGAELSFVYKKHLNSIRASLSHATPNGQQVDVFQVTNEEDRFTGLENTKATFVGTFNFLNNDYFITPSVVYIGTRFSQEYSTEISDVDFEELDESFLVNLVFEKKNFLRDELLLTFGIYNLLDDDFRIAQAHNSFHTSVPTEGRSAMLRLSSTF